jgi:hypothetical protein
VVEQVAHDTLAAVLEEEAASRSRVEQTTIAIAERVGRGSSSSRSAPRVNRNGAAGAIDRDRIRRATPANSRRKMARAP